MELLKPTPGFCIRSTLASKKDKKFQQKIYINMCMHETVGAPSIEGTDKSGKSWLVNCRIYWSNF